ncbi:hypothetical protein C6497_14730 [Candidatus Poribacteria bacterium]|nr:MAG: hypothetical protein C6497_14730 [Candidatus Poribacteria bacterium]
MRKAKKHLRSKEGVNHRIYQPKRVKNKNYRARRTTILISTVITLLFLAKIFLGFFNIEHVTFALFGNIHYTEGQVFDVLGENLDNIITDSEEKTALYIKDNLSYIEDANVTRNLIKRLLTIEITERKPFARVNFKVIDNTSINKDNTKHYSESLLLIDDEGYVLETISIEQFPHLIIIIDEGEVIPEIGKQIESHTTHIGIHILKTINTKERTIAKHLKSIDPRVSQKITIKIDSLPIPIWISEDMIDTGLHKISLFVRNNMISHIQNQETQIANNITKDQSSKGIPVYEKYEYLDIRYEDTLYLGGSNK